MDTIHVLTLLQLLIMLLTTECTQVRLRDTIPTPRRDGGSPLCIRARMAFAGVL